MGDDYTVSYRIVSYRIVSYRIISCLVFRVLLAQTEEPSLLLFSIYPLRTLVLEYSLFPLVRLISLSLSGSSLSLPLIARDIGRGSKPQETKENKRREREQYRGQE